MEKLGLLRKPSSYESESVLKSSPNILENFGYEDFKNTSLNKSFDDGMTTAIKKPGNPPVGDELAISNSLSKHEDGKRSSRPASPKFSETIEKNLFMTKVIKSPPDDELSSGGESITKNARSKEKDVSVRRSLEEISKDIKEIEDFLTVTENILQKEKELDKELYTREHERKLNEKCKNSTATTSSGNRQEGVASGSTESLGNPGMESQHSTSSKKNSPVGSRRSSPTFKINSYKSTRKGRNSPPKLNISKLYFRNGKIGCADAEKNTSNIESTHALVQNILKFESEKPLVSPESVQRALSKYRNEEEILYEENFVKKRKFEEVIIEKSPRALANRAIDQNVEKLEKVLTLPKERKLNVCKNTEETHGPNIEENKNREVSSINSNIEKAKPIETNEPISEEDKVSQQVEEMKIEYSEPAEIQNEEKAAQHEDKESLLEDKTLLNESNSDGKIESLGFDTSDGQQFVKDRVRHLVRRFTARANKMRSVLELPPTPSSSTSSPSPIPFSSSYNHVLRGTPKKSEHRSRQDLFEADHRSIRSNGASLCSGFCGGKSGNGVLDPQGKIYISWLCVVSLTFLYNAWVIPLRSAFPFQTSENTFDWLIADLCADAIYLLDVAFFKHRVMYLFEGFWVKDKELTRKNYIRKLQFKLDVLALVPLDLFYLKYGTNAIYFRFPRLLKIQSFWEVFKLLDRVTSSPHFVRVAKTLTYMLYMIHLTACSYYAYSAYQGLGSNRWVFSGKGHPYVRCFAFATKTATSIGKNPKPENEGELVFMTAAWLMGVFVFALLIGQIRDIISTATRSQSEYRQLEDETLEYMRRLNLPKDIQNRVKMWFKFTWDQQRTLDESHILDSLPANLKTDIAISVHIQTLSKVQLFADCEEALLRELVLKLRSVTFLPGDYVCRKGEVGKEMYIVKLGQVQVMGGLNNDEVLATLSEGSVFGEISLLAINGVEGNRRTADVKSKGFSNLFVLSKSDLNEAIVYYPNAQAILKRRARSLMRKNAAREREEAKRSALLKADVIIKNPTTPETSPKLLNTVIQALHDESATVVLLNKESKECTKDSNIEMEKGIEKIKGIRNDNNSDISSAQTNTNSNLKRSSENFVIIENVKRSKSPDLLSSIQDELHIKNKFINLTDSEKALIISSSSSSNDEECEVTVHKEM